VVALWQDARMDTPSDAPGALEAALGWQRPAMHGTGWIVQAYLGDDAEGEPILEEVPGEVTFTRVNSGTAYPAAAAVATVVGHRGGSGSYPLSRDDLDRAADLLEAAGADAADLEVWREMQDAEEGEAIYVFLGDRARRSGDPYVHRLIEVVESGRQDVTYGEPHWWPAERAATDPYPLIAAWAAAWPGALPIAHELKELFEEAWVRFHSLPGSKRYADTDDEYAEILSRHNTVLAELGAEAAGELVVIAAEVASTPAPTGAPAFEDCYPADTFWAAVPWHYADPDLLFAHLYVRRFDWQPGILDDLLIAVADGDLPGVIVAPAGLRWLYHPYDGGADVVLPSVAERDELAAKHREWRSAHPSGL
jgi:hypothetical protein